MAYAHAYYSYIAGRCGFRYRYPSKFYTCPVLESQALPRVIIIPIGWLKHVGPQKKQKQELVTQENECEHKK